MKSEFSFNNFGICLKQGHKRTFLWFGTEADQLEKIAVLNSGESSAQGSQIEWVGHFDDLVYTTCDFSRSIHKRFFQLRVDVHAVEDGWVSRESLSEFYHFLNSEDV